MSAPVPPTAAHYAAFFTQRLNEILSTDRELIWVSSHVPVEALPPAYALGIFPWPGGEPDVFPWVCPQERGVLPFDRLHVGKSTRRHLDRAGYRVTMNQAFEDVISACAAMPGRETWIQPEMIRAYTRAHELGFAHSVEVRDDSGDLVGGLYGIEAGGVFSGESMFHLQPNAGKAAILHLVEVLRANGHALLDIQQLTPHLAALGAVEWTRETYLRFLLSRRALGKKEP